MHKAAFPHPPSLIWTSPSNYLILLNPTAILTKMSSIGLLLTATLSASLRPNPSFRHPPLPRLVISTLLLLREVIRPLALPSIWDLAPPNRRSPPKISPLRTPLNPCPLISPTPSPLLAQLLVLDFANTLRKNTALANLQRPNAASLP